MSSAFLLGQLPVWQNFFTLLFPSSSSSLRVFTFYSRVSETTLQNRGQPPCNTVVPVHILPQAQAADNYYFHFFFSKPLFVSSASIMGNKGLRGKRIVFPTLLMQRQQAWRFSLSACCLCISQVFKNSAGVIITGFFTPDSKKSLSPVSSTSAF